MALQFKIQLKDVNNPTVWRRIIVPDTFTFFDLHNAIQVSMGWNNYHLFEFSDKGWGSDISITDKTKEEDFGGNSLEARDVKITEIFRTEKMKFVYIYDFGDDWHHTITFEKQTEETILYPRCLKAQGACPPEDCGGAWGYQNIKDILADPEHEEYADTIEWLGIEPGDTWDAVMMDDLDDINAMLIEAFS